MIERILELEWLVLALRILFVLLLYLFIAQVIRFGIREMVGAGIAGAPPRYPPPPPPRLRTRGPAPGRGRGGARKGDPRPRPSTPHPG